MKWNEKLKIDQLKKQLETLNVDLDGIKEKIEVSIINCF